MKSLRSKIILSFSLTNIAILIVAATVYTDLGLLQQQILDSEQVREILSATQQLQNHEENLVSFRSLATYYELSEQIDETRRVFDETRPFYENVIGPGETYRLNESLRRYREQVDLLLNQEESEFSGAQISAIRATSQSILNTASLIGLRHHEYLSNETEVVSTTLVVALSVVIMMGVISALIISKKVVQPIASLERQLDAVAETKLKKLSLVSRDIEIKSFVQHFNSMLDKIRSQQTQLRHHEKAAALGVLVSGVAHELNNPLSNISTSVQLLLEDDDAPISDLQKQWLAHIDSETERSRRIVRRLLDSVRTPKLKLKKVGAAEMVRSSVLLIHRQLDPNINLHIEDLPDTCIDVDRERMQQVFINLIRNAVSAGAYNIWVFADITTWTESMPKDIDRVQGEVSSISQMEHVLMFTISDDGPGIPDEHLSQLFTPFFTTKTGGEGTGLGLYLVEEIIDEHNGCITVENRDEGGTQFLVWLPVSGEDCPS